MFIIFFINYICTPTVCSIYRTHKKKRISEKNSTYFLGVGRPWRVGTPVSNGSLVPAYHLILTLDIFSMPNFKPTILAEYCPNGFCSCRFDVKMNPRIIDGLKNLFPRFSLL